MRRLAVRIGVWFTDSFTNKHTTMTLLELKDKIDDTIERIREAGQSPDDIPVTLQLEHGGGDAWGHSSMDVVWDNNTQATGCVIVADMDGKS